MREIKFRIWNKVLKKFDPAGLPIMHNSEKGIFGVDNSYVEHFVAQQYTGLKDKNGVEIYEGDVVEIYLTGPVETSRPNIGKVFWNEEDLCFSIEVEISTGVVDWGFEYTELEVLGNIFEGVDK